MLKGPWVRLATLTALIASLAVALPAAAESTPPQVSVYPSPGTKYNSPQSQIAFRGIPASQLGAISVVGSVTGAHSGQIEPDSDGDGGSFVPSSPFAAGETVTVTTSLNVVGGKNGGFSFAIDHPSSPIVPMMLPVVKAGSDGLQYFRSVPQLLPASITVTTNRAPASEGDIFLTPQYGPDQNGPMILDPSGNLVWFDPVPVSSRMLFSDFRVQNLFGSKVLTWWQGTTNNGTGEGEGVIVNANYQQITTVQAGNGLIMDLHEFLVTPQGDAYIFADAPLSVPSIVGKPTIDPVIQEIDIKTGLVLFQWDALDHVPLSDSYFSPKHSGFVFDPYHGNSVGVEGDGNLIVSLRNTNTVYKINRQSGQIMWELGGRQSSFKMGPGTATAFQHDAVVQPNGNLTIFDDGAGPPRIHPYSRGIRVSINTSTKTATLVKEYDHSPDISGNFEGSVQVLPDGNVFMGWGQQPYFSEDDPAGQQIFDAHFTVPTSSYRAYRFPWTGQPLTAPALAFSANANGSPELYASWNGATTVGSWRVLAGTSQGSLAAIGGDTRRGFESAIPPATEAPYLEVQALSTSGKVLATSPVVSDPAHVEVYGASAFATSTTGFGAIPVGCFATTTCAFSTTIASGRTVLARTSSTVASRATGLVYFRLSPSGREGLVRAPGRRLPVQVTVQDGTGPRATASMNLIPFSTGGGGPRRSLSPASTLALAGSTDFVNSRGTGGILADCHAAVSPCRVNGTISVGRTVIARFGPETLGAGDLGYLIFSLTSAGSSIVAHAPGNQLGAQVTLTSGGESATGQIALVRFS